MAVATLDGQLTFWDISTALQLHSIEGRNDLGGGRKSSDRMTSKTSSAFKYVVKIYYIFCFLNKTQCDICAGVIQVCVTRLMGRVC